MMGLESDFNYENDLMEYTTHSEHKQELIRNIISDMRHTLNQKELTELNHTLIHRLQYVEILGKELPYEQDVEKENEQLKQEKKEICGRSGVCVKELERVNEMMEYEIVMLKTTLARNEGLYL